MRQLIDIVAEQSGLTSLLEEGVGVIAIHVRSMDACNDNRPCLPFRTYLDAAISLAQEYQSHHEKKKPTTALFVASDNQTVIEECLSLSPSQLPRGMRCIAAGGFNRTLLDPKLYGAHHIEDAKHFAQQKGLIWDPATFGLMTIIEMELMARCHAFVGSFSSTMDVEILGLMLARRHVLPPYHSLEPEGTNGRGMLRNIWGERRGVFGKNGRMKGRKTGSSPQLVAI